LIPSATVGKLPLLLGEACVAAAVAMLGHTEAVTC
jgi:hypothetical protein